MHAQLHHSEANVGQIGENLRAEISVEQDALATEVPRTSHGIKRVGCTTRFPGTKHGVSTEGSGRSDFGHGRNGEGSLPVKYNALQTARDSVPEERQTLDNLLERLLKEERRLEGDDDVTRALAAVSLGGNKKKKFAANQNNNSEKNRESRNTSVE